MLLQAEAWHPATAGTVTDEVIKKYIEGRQWTDDGGKGFQIAGEP